MSRACWLCLVCLLVPGQSMASQENAVPGCTGKQETVVLLHGLLRSAASMRVMQQALQRQGYRVLNIDYPSRQHALPVLAETVFSGLRSTLDETSCPVHFVTHSMGGILLRYYLAEHEVPALGRVVMLGPPNQGSEVVDKLGGLALFNWVNGPAGRQLGTDGNSIPAQLGAADFELGVIAGNRSINPILSTLIPGADDGKVAVARTRLEGMRDFLEMPHTHVFMMRRAEVIRQTLHFLRSGQFDHSRVTQ